MKLRSKFDHSLLLVTILILLPGAAFATQKFVPDIVVTGTSGIWTDSRAYNSLADAVAAIGSNKRTIYIARVESVGTNLTIGSNIQLVFLRDGAINQTSGSTTLTFQTRSITAPDRPIFTGNGHFDFAEGTVLRTSWFESFNEAISETSDDTNVVLEVSSPATLTANATTGSTTTLRFGGTGNVITLGIYNLAINGKLEAGRVKLFHAVSTGKVTLSNNVSEIYPEWWGAVGNGVQDDTAAMNAAFSAISSTGGTVSVGSGVFPISSAILMYSDTTLILEADSVVRAKSPCIMFRNATTDSPGNSRIVVLGRGGIVDGNNRTHKSTEFYSGISLRHVTDCRVDGVIVWDTPGPGINLERTGGRCVVTNNIINGDPTGLGRVFGTNYYGCDGGITVQDAISTPITEIIVSGNILKNCQEGIGFNAQSGVTNEGRVVCNNNVVRSVSGGDGITFAGYSRFVCSGNYIEETKNNGIGARLFSGNNSQYSSISGNVIARAGYYAPAGEDAHGIKLGRLTSTDDGYLAIAGNTIVTSGNSTAGGDGIRLSRSTKNVAISGNMIYDSAEYGINCQGTSGNELKSISISGGIVARSGKSGIFAYYTDLLSISGVVVTDNGSSGTNPYGVSIEACDGVTITGIISTDSGSTYQQRGIRAAASCTDVVILGNNLAGNTTGPFLSIPDQTTTNVIAYNQGAYDAYTTLPTGSTPSIARAYMFTTANGSSTTVTNLTGGYRGKIITIRGNDNGNTTIAHGTYIKTKSGSNVTLTNGAIIMLQFGANDIWYEL